MLDKLLGAVSGATATVGTVGFGIDDPATSVVAFVIGALLGAATIFVIAARER